MNPITINRAKDRAIIRTSHTWYSVSLSWLRDNVKFHPQFAEALRMLEPKHAPAELIGRVVK